MPSLMQSLQGQDFGYLRIIAKLWNLEFSAPDEKVGLQRLIPLLLSSDLFAEIIEALPLEAQEALQDIQGNNGRMRWTFFTRRYGEIREMGAARRDREHPYQENTTISEMLWYRGLIGINFFDAPEGPQEFAYIPDEFLAFLPPGMTNTMPVLGRKATSNEFAFVIPANDSILDETCMLLAMLRKGEENILNEMIYLESRESSIYPSKLQHLKTLLLAAGLIDVHGGILLEPTRKFLEASRGDALLALSNAWLFSKEFNELCMLPGLICEGEWQNDPLLARKSVLSFLYTLEDIPSPINDKIEASFWSLSPFIFSIRQSHPDFQRPTGDYDSWYLKDQTSGENLRGFEHWDDVEGKLIRFMIEGPLHWLGFVDIGLSEEMGMVNSFRFSELAYDLLNNKPPQNLDVEKGTLYIKSNGRVSASPSVPRSIRYQIARFSKIGITTSDGYQFQITPSSLKAAQQQGLRVSQLLSLLQKHSKNLPPNLKKALKRWESYGYEVMFKRVSVLQLSDAGLMKSLLSSTVSRYLGEQLSPTAVIVKEDAKDKILTFLMDLGYFGEFEEG